MVEQHINTFDKGMTSDTSILYQPDGTYRYLRNCQLITQDGNNFTIKDTMGNLKTFRINRPYDETYTVGGTYPCPIGFISFPDECIVFSTNDTTDGGGYGEIGLLKYFPYGEGYQPLDADQHLNAGYVPLYHHNDLNFSKLHQIEGFAFEENSAIKRIYWTDNHNQPRVFNIADPIFTTYIASGSIQEGVQYMVLEGAVTYNAVNYGPGLAAGNIFTGIVAVTTYTNLTGTTPTPKIIEYYPVELLDFNPQRLLANMKFDEYGSGNVFCGEKIYFYRLKKTTEGIVTSWSYGSSPIHVGTINDSVTAEAYPEYFNFVGNQLEGTIVNSGYSVKVLISEIDTNFNVIELACAEYDEGLNTIRQITIVQSEEITGSEMSIEHTGNINLGDLTLADVMLFPINIKTCKTMTSNKNFALVGNITERMEFSFSYDDTVMGAVDQTDYHLPTHPYDTATPAICPNVQSYFPAFADANNNPGAGDILLGTHWVVLGPGTATYNAVTYIEGDIFTGVAGVQALTGTTGGCQVRPCHAYTRYVPQNGSAERWNHVQIKQGGMPAAYWNYKHPATASHVKGYWNGETYRFGILFYDKQGNPFYVRHLTDYTFSTQNDAGCSYIDDTGGVDWMGLLVHGLKLSNIRISREIAENISGFSIVRAERDKRILCQALMWQIGSGPSVPYADAYYPCANYIQNSTAANSNTSNRYILITPDWNAAFPGVTPTTANFSHLELASWVSANGNVENTATDANNNYETPMLVEVRPDSNGVVIKDISYVTGVNEGETISDPFGTGLDYVNFDLNGATLTVDTECVSGIPSSADLGFSTAVGNKQILIQIDSQFNYYNTVDDYSDLATAGKAKALVNIVFDNAGAQYGGTSETSLAATTYIQCGHFQPINAEVIADNNDTNNINTYTELIFDGVEVYGGDAYTCLIDNCFGLIDDDATTQLVPVTSDYFSYTIKFPCQTSVNYELRNGRTISKNRTFFTANGVVFDYTNLTRLEEYYYNNSYSSEGTAFQYAALPLNYPNTDTFRTRIRYAGPKLNGEIVNSFRNFASGDFKDMDGGGGEINNLRTKNGQTVVWQNAIISTVPILERQVMTGLSGAETTIGTGGVVDRFDPITSFYGNQHQWGLTATEFGYAWFDMRRKAFMLMDFSIGIVEISQALGMKGLFDEAFVEAMNNTNFDNYVNAPNFNDASDRPVIGVGINGVYDPKFKMVYMTFKFKQDASSNPFKSIISKDFTIGYYHPRKMFVGFYDYTPGIQWNHNQLVISSNNAKNLTKYYGPTMGSVDFVAGDIIGDGVSTYVALTSSTISSYVSPPSGTLFAKLTDESELWVHNQPNSVNFTASPPPDYVYDKFFGYVVDNQHKYVVNPRTVNPFNVQHTEHEGNDVKFTDLTLTAESQTVTESNIPASSNFYRVIWDKICFSMPVTAILGRIVNSYLLVDWTKKNWSTDRRVLTKGTKILRRAVSFFSQKR